MPATQVFTLQEADILEAIHPSYLLRRVESTAELIPEIKTKADDQSPNRKLLTCNLLRHHTPTGPTSGRRAAIMAGFFGLAKLPPELLDQVLEEVETDPCHLSCMDARLHNSGTRNVNGLASLCLVSRQMSQLAIGRLYRDLRRYNAAYWAWWLLARTLIERRDLAGLVRHLDIVRPPILKYPPLPLPEVAAYYAKLVALPTGASLPVGGLSSDEPDTVWEAAIALMTSLCPI